MENKKIREINTDHHDSILSLFQKKDAGGLTCYLQARSDVINSNLFLKCYVGSK